MRSADCGNECTFQTCFKYASDAANICFTENMRAQGCAKQEHVMAGRTQKHRKRQEWKEKGEGMKIKKVLEKLETQYPLTQAMTWDNPGLQVGRADRSVKKVYVALDATQEVISACVEWGAQLLITHHPLMMSGIRKVNDSDMYGRKILSLVENGIAHYAMHTNYDVTTMRTLAQHIMKLKNAEILEMTGTGADGEPCGIGFVAQLPKKMTAALCCDFVKKSFGLESVRLFGDPEKEIQRIAVSPGSGKSMIGPALSAKAELLVTGDIGHHDGLDALDQSLMIVDAGHYGIEHIFIEQMTSFLSGSFPELKVRGAKICEPFTVR